MTDCPRERFLSAAVEWDELPAYSPNAILDGRKAAAEEELLAAAEAWPEAPKGRARRLFRGITLTSREQVERLLAGAPLDVPQTALSSWTRAERIARSFANEWAACGNGLVVRRAVAELDVLVDLRVLRESMTPDERRRFPISMSAVRESEVIVRNVAPVLEVRPQDVAWRNPDAEEMLSSPHLADLAARAAAILDEIDAARRRSSWTP